MKRLNLSVISIFLAALVILLPVCFADEIKMTEGVILKNNNSSKDPVKNNIPPVHAASVVDVFPGLAAAIVILILPYVTAIAIGATVIVAGLVVYHYGTTAWTYYTAYSYSSVTNYAEKHINDFPWIWTKPPPREDFDNKCKDNINSKSSTKYIQDDGRMIAYNPINYMITVGEVDGKTVVNCFPAGSSKSAAEKYINNKVKDGVWKLLE